MNFWEPESLRASTGGRWVVPPPPAKVQGAAIDSRVCKPGNIFFALRGERTDGHLHVEAAAATGAALAIIDRPDSLPAGAADRLADRCGVLAVADVAATLITLGGLYRRSLTGTTVISIGGSNGKTTTTRLVDAALASTLRGTASPKSFNNSIGVPLTLLNAAPGDRYVVCEVGTNAPGEIAALAKIVRPDVAVITSIGREHLEGLGDLQGVAREEAAILPHLMPGGVAIVNADSPHLLDISTSLLSQIGGTLLSYGEGSVATIRLGNIAMTEAGVSAKLSGFATEFRCPLLGRHNAWNMAAAAIVARRLGVPEDGIAKGLAHAKGPDWRMQRVDLQLPGGTAVAFNDAYNANPESMRAALDAFAELGAAGKRRVVVLADMLELGSGSDALHAEIVDKLAEHPPELSVFVGPSMCRAGRSSPLRSRAEFFEKPDANAISRVASLIKPGDRVLLKGSRGMGLERVVTAALTTVIPQITPLAATPGA